MPTPKYRILLRVILAGAALFAIAFLGIGSICATSPTNPPSNVWEMLRGSHDLHLRYNEVRFMLLGENPYRLAREHRLQDRSEEVFGPGHPMDPDYFPSTLLPVLLLAKLPWPAVKIIWLLTTLVLVVVLVRDLHWMMGGQSPPGDTYALMICLWMCGIPFWSGLAMGQSSLFSFSLMVAAFRADVSGRPWLSAILLTFGVFKYALIWPLVLFFFILQWRWRPLVIAGGIHLVVHLLLCHQIQADPVAIFGEILQVNSKVYQRNDLLTVWLPFRMLDRVFPSLGLPAQLLGALLFLGILGGMVWLWLKRERNSRTHLLIWCTALPLLATVAVTTRIYAHVYTLPGLLLACSPALPQATTLRRGRLITYILYLSYVPSGADDLGLSLEVRHWMLLVFDLTLAALAIELGILLRSSAPPAPPGRTA